MPREYATAKAFRTALETRLNETAERSKIQVNRLRRQVAFDRLLMRLFRTDPAPWVLKGGYALELRFRTARATIDIDLTVRESRPLPKAMPSRSCAICFRMPPSFRLGDWFEYTIGAPAIRLSSGIVDFGASDVPMTAAQLARATGGPVVQVPVDLGAVVVSYNLAKYTLFDPLRLTGAVLARIYLGKITNWDDPAIAALNPADNLPDQKITVVHRSDGSGTTVHIHELPLDHLAPLGERARDGYFG